MSDNDETPDTKTPTSEPESSDSPQQGQRPRFEIRWPTDLSNKSSETDVTSNDFDTHEVETLPAPSKKTPVSSSTNTSSDAAEESCAPGKSDDDEDTRDRVPPRTLETKPPRKDSADAAASSPGSPTNTAPAPEETSHSPSASPRGDASSADEDDETRELRLGPILRFSANRKQTQREPVKSLGRPNNLDELRAAQSKRAMEPSGNTGEGDSSDTPASSESHPAVPMPGVSNRDQSKPTPATSERGSAPSLTALSAAVRDTAKPKPTVKLGPKRSVEHGPELPLETASDDATPPAEQASGSKHSRRLWDLVRFKRSRSQLIVAILCAALGFAIVVQVRQSQTDTLSTLRQDELVRLLDEVTTETHNLVTELETAKTMRDELLSSTDKERAALDSAKKRATVQGILAGTLPVEGPGITITISNTDQVGAKEMINLLEELRNAGAESIQLNDIRLVADSWFSGSAGELVVDGNRLKQPYEWKAIGSAQDLEVAVDISGGAAPQIRKTGATVSIERETLVTIDAVKLVKEPNYATPVPSSTKGS